MNLGKAMLQKVLKQEGFRLQRKLFNHDFHRQFKCENTEDLLPASARAISRRATCSRAPSRPQAEGAATDITEHQRGRAEEADALGKAAPMPIKGLIPGMALHFARCCHPLPGDRIVGEGLERLAVDGVS